MTRDPGLLDSEEWCRRCGEEVVLLGTWCGPCWEEWVKEAGRPFLPEDDLKGELTNEEGTEAHARTEPEVAPEQQAVLGGNDPGTAERRGAAADEESRFLEVTDDLCRGNC